MSSCAAPLPDIAQRLPDTSEVSTVYLHVAPKCGGAAAELVSLRVPGLLNHTLGYGHVALTDRPTRASFAGIGVFGDRLCPSGQPPPSAIGRGNYMVVRIECGTTRIIADPLGTYPVFYFDGPNFFAASNDIFRLREALAQLGAECPRLSLIYAGFITLGCAPGGITGFEGIRMLPVGAEIVFRADGSAGIERRPLADLLYCSADLDELLERADDEIRSNVRAIATGGFDDLSCDLTGGMDSRLVVAAILAERLGNAFSMVTRGDQSAPDAQVAAMIREKFGLRRSSGGVSKVGTQEPLSGLQHALWRSQGMMELPFIFASPPAFMRLTGGLGELMRTFWSNPPDGPPLGRLHQNLARAGTKYISPFAARRLRRMIAEDATAILEEGVASEDLGDAFYLASRNRYHFGVPWRGSGAQFHPLYSPAAIAAAHKLRRERRRINAVGHALMSRWSRDLAAMPFADKAWHHSLTKPTPPVKASPTSSGDDASRGGRWRATKRAFGQRFPSPDLTVLAPHFWTSGVRELMSRKSRLSKPEVVRASRTICAYLWMDGQEVE
jgi:hypothetical protein